MGRREYDQPCGLACALDQIGERWSLLIVRELLLGPLRFSELAQSIGGAPTDVLTKRLRSLEEAGVVRRVELDPPAAATAYELTELGMGLERPLLELSRWGLHFQDLASVAEMPPSQLPNALRIVLRPRSRRPAHRRPSHGGRDYGLRIGGGWIEASRGRMEEADLILTGTPWQVLATVIGGVEGEPGAAVEGDPGPSSGCGGWCRSRRASATAPWKRWLRPLPELGGALAEKLAADPGPAFRGMRKPPLWARSWWSCKRNPRRDRLPA